MIFIRSALFLLVQLIFTPVFSSIALLTFPFGAMTRYRFISYYARIMLWFLKVIVGIDYQVKGRENIPDQPCIILCKHQSAWETLALQAVFPPQAWVLKRELLWIPFFGWALALTSPVAINRSDGKSAMKQLLKQGKERIRQGFFVVIFPEGTRVPYGQRGQYKIGGALLASSSKQPVIPVAHNAGKYWGRKAFVKKPGTITMSIGTLIETKGKKADAITQQVEQWIEQAIAEMDSCEPAEDTVLNAKEQKFQ